MSISFRVVEHPSDPSREIRLELAPSIKTLKYGPVRDTCTIIDLSKQDIEKVLDMTEWAMNIRGVMMGQETLEITKMVITEIWYTQDEEIVRVESQLMDQDDLAWGCLWATEDEKQETARQYMSYVPRRSGLT